MRKVAAVSLAVVAMAGSSAFAGLATFSPSPQDNVPQGTSTVSMDLTLTAQELQNFDGADIIINSDVPFTFNYADAFKTAANAFVLDPGVPVGVGVRLTDLYVAGASSNAGAFGTSINMGTVVFDTASLDPGTYDVLISFDADGGNSFINRQGVTEAIEGRGSFTVVPEPATMGLMLLGAVGLLRRRIAG